MNSIIKQISDAISSKDKAIDLERQAELRAELGTPAGRARASREKLEIERAGLQRDLDEAHARIAEEQRQAIFAERNAAAQQLERDGRDAIALAERLGRELHSATTRFFSIVKELEAFDDPAINGPHRASRLLQERADADARVFQYVQQSA